SLKPFLYALALEKGWHAASFLNDAPLSEAVGTGLHRFRNYSRGHYGWVSVREALGNSLNIPALLTIRHVGVADYMTVLQQLGFKSLQRNADYYDEGLALGNGEVTLLELAQAYMVLAQGGVKRPLRFLMNDRATYTERRIYSYETASLIGNILSDPWARRLEFGGGGALNLPVQTAVKTGTSTDYRDAWVAGYNDKYVVAIWMGNLDRTATDGVTGASGPAMALRGIFAKLNTGRETKSLSLSPHLVLRDVCVRPVADCARRQEWMRPDDVIEDYAPSKRVLEMVRPTDGLQLAYDPRVPAAHQKFRFEIAGLAPDAAVSWYLNDQFLAQTMQGTYLWPVQRGHYSLRAQIKNKDGSTLEMAAVKFTVK
ncbi:MAG TPA: penicillin-binding transpeptidase domain-containing protein, partial [Micavibrio sp.]